MAQQTVSRFSMKWEVARQKLQNSPAMIANAMIANTLMPYDARPAPFAQGIDMCCDRAQN
jgi:hypothetical protein